MTTQLETWNQLIAEFGPPTHIIKPNNWARWGDLCIEVWSTGETVDAGINFGHTDVAHHLSPSEALLRIRAYFATLGQREDPAAQKAQPLSPEQWKAIVWTIWRPGKIVDAGLTLGQREDLAAGLRPLPPAHPRPTPRLVAAYVPNRWGEHT